MFTRGYFGILWHTLAPKLIDVSRRVAGSPAEARRMNGRVGSRRYPARPGDGGRATRSEITSLVVYARYGTFVIL